MWYNFYVVIRQPGDVMAHCGNTIHQARANFSTTRHRRAFAGIFKGKSCVRDEEAYPRYLAAAKSQQCSLGITS